MGSVVIPSEVGMSPVETREYLQLTHATDKTGDRDRNKFRELGACY